MRWEADIGRQGQILLVIPLRKPEANIATIDAWLG